jgi:hypothetical protein
MTTKRNIRPGDMVILGAVNGLGTNPFRVLNVLQGNIIFQLYVQGANGQTWYARIDGAQIVDWPSANFKVPCYNKSIRRKQ